MKIIIFFLFFAISFASCKTIKESAYAKENIVNKGFRQIFFNDSLKMSIAFYGGHKIENPPLKNYNKYTPPTLKKFLIKDLSFSLKPKILLFSGFGSRSFGFWYFGFIQNHKDHNNKEMESENHSTFLSAGRLQKVDSFLVIKYIVPLAKKDFILYCFTKILNDFSSDSTVIVNNSLNELMTLRSRAHYVPFGKEKSVADSAIFLSDLPGYGTPLNKLLDLKENTYDKNNTGFLNQILYTAYSFFDQVDTIRQLLYEEHTSKGNSIANRSSQLIEVDHQLAIPKILKEADNQKVIMVNESHYDWRHRYFATLLLDSLHKKGYKYLCMEALSNEMNINKRKFPTNDDGFYLKEPFMANLARTALKIGYTLVAYEDTTKQDSSNQDLFHSPVDKREYNQALNLYNHFKQDSTAKWIVYAGYSHINKLNFSAKEPSTMAKYFAEFSHVNPYSINQSMYADLFSNKVPVSTIGRKEDFFYLRNDQVDDTDLLKQSDLYRMQMVFSPKNNF